MSRRRRIYEGKAKVLFEGQESGTLVQQFKDDAILSLTLRINDFLSGLFLGVGLKLVDFKLEYGRLWEGEEMRIVLADEISPDSCRLWDVKTNEKLDKDRFRRDLGKVAEAYQE